MLITPAGYILLALFVVSVFLAYKWLRPASKEEKPGCLSIGLASLVICMLLAFPVMVSVQFFENGTQELRIAIIIGWALLIALVAYIIKTGSYKKLPMLIGRGCVSVVIPLMIFGMACLMGYFLYLRFFTHQKDDTPVWATILVSFFFVVLLLIPVGMYNQRKVDKQARKTTFTDLETAIRNPTLVMDLNLSNRNLSVFPQEILQFKSLQLLDLSQNQIQQIPDEIRHMDKLVSVNLSGNPIADQERIRIRKAFGEIEFIF